MSDGVETAPAAAAAAIVGSASMSVAEVTGLVHLFNNQLAAAEARIVANQQRERDANTAWMSRLEAHVMTVENTLKAHLDEEARDEIVMNARVQPVKNVFGFATDHWKDIMILVVGAAAVISSLLDTLHPTVN